ncbi:DUF2141 domain-containing protein [Aquimarina sp. 2201CG5-10]|uniref:DUF2141 domain-containing protein n=1 Tax=Aquimarina callyspongiae TaxID=3098150 RepID=UPI002AB4707C|nr:DUF2141 domain-containing protein [Aquimarina sp. 2201CG5-10]MDY8137385.1 DUF2141 domain-containing protein [Aquimarina sp. 2201CG5-10]
MKTIQSICILVLTIIITTISTAQESKHVIEVNITNIKSDTGTLQIGLYNNKESFLGKPYKSINVKAVKGKVQVYFDNVPEGEYGISLYHDKDGNKKINTFLGIPTEPYGTSNNAKGRFGPPKWEDAKFTLSDNKAIQNIKL